MIYIAVEYGLHSMLPIARDGEISAIQIGEYDTDQLATTAAAAQLKGEVYRVCYIAKGERRFTIFTNTEYQKLLMDIEEQAHAF